MRILALDIGSKRIGVAVSDPMGWTAQGITTWRRKGSQDDQEAIVRWVADYGVEEILIGLPLQMSGEEGIQAASVRGFAETLKKRIVLPIRFWDERLTTVSAEKGLLEADLSRAKRREVIDKVAAVLILQSYLDWRREQGKEGKE